MRSDRYKDEPQENKKEKKARAEKPAKEKKVKADKVRADKPAKEKRIKADKPVKEKLLRREKQPKTEAKAERKTETLKRPTAYLQTLMLGRDEVEAELREAAFSVGGPAALAEDGFIAGVRSAEPVLSVDDSAAESSWKKDLPSVIAGAVLLMAFMSLFMMATWSTENIPFLIPGALVYAGLSMTGSIKPGRTRWIASAVLAALLVASAVIFRGQILGGVADMFNLFYDYAESAQAYVYRRFLTTGTGNAIMGSVWLSCLIGLLASLPPAGARRTTMSVIAMIAMFAFAYYGMIPSWICIAVMIVALMVSVSRGNVLASLPLILSVMIVFGAVMLVNPGENYSISRFDENFRDRFALNSVLLQQNEPEPTDLSGLQDLNNKDQDLQQDNTSDVSHANLVAIGTVVIIIAVIAAAAYLFWRRYDKRRKEVRAGLDSTDPREAVTAMFPYTVRWLKAGGVETGTTPFYSLTSAVESEFSKNYAERYRDMYLLWREAAYSDHEIDMVDKTDMDGFLRETVDMVKEKLSFRDRVIALVKYAL